MAYSLCGFLIQHPQIVYPSFSSYLPTFSDQGEKSNVLEGNNKRLNDKELDFLVAILGLLVNLVEKDGRNRSLPDLELVKVTSLMSILRWSFKANIERTMSSMENGQIAMENVSEVAFISLLNDGDNIRDLESLPSLHDKVLAGALEAVINNSQNQKKKQGVPGVLAHILKGFSSGKANNGVNFHEDFKSGFGNLDKIFSKYPFPDPLESITNDQDDVELDIDDIETMTLKSMNLYY